MASASVNTQAFSRETSNYSRLCRLLVEVGTLVLRETFNKIHPPESLHVKLSSHPVLAHLELLYKGQNKILNPTQWEQLYPSNPSSVSSLNFDAILLMVLLRNISGLNPPTSGWGKPPPAKDTSIGADITRLWVFRNEINDHASKAQIDDLTFEEYWKDIQQTLTRLGGDRYGPYIVKRKTDYMDPDIALQYQERLRQWRKDEVITDQIEGNLGCVYAETLDISTLDPLVAFKTTSEHWGVRVVVKKMMRSLRSWGKPKADACSRVSAYGTNEIPLNRAINLHKVSARNGVNRITSCHTEETRKANKAVVARLDKAINLQQSDHIAGARKELQGLFENVRSLGQRFFSNPTKEGWIVLRRGKEIFLEDSVNCSVKHGTLLLDSSNSGAQFYSGLLNVIGAFAVVISEFKMAKEAFSLLTDFHQQSAETSRKRDLGAAYNNEGCISLILGELKQAVLHFKTALKHLESAKERHQLHNPLLEAMSIAINSNIGRLHMISRNYSKALGKQVQLVQSCKTKEVKELPLQVVFTVLNNLAVLYTTLGKFSKAEQELKWLLSYCYNMQSEDCNFLLNFVRLHLSEVFLFHGNPKEAEKAFGINDDIDFAEMFGGLHINVRIETVEKWIDVIVLKGKIRFACQLLDRGVTIVKNIFGPDHFNVASLLYQQGTILTLAGEVSSAEEKFRCSIETLEEIFGIKHPLLLKCYMSLGELALRSKRADDSYFYSQRAMENMEAMYEVSFVNQLSRTYLEMTSSNTFHQSKMVHDTSKIEGLVAEHGVVLAVLLSRPVVQDGIPPLRRSKTKLRQPPSTNYRDVQCPDSKEIVSLKYTSDFLQTGKTFLRQGMRKEAAAFFQQAKKYSRALNATQGPTYACVARLYDVLTMKRLGNRQSLENKHEMSSCLEELNELSAEIGTCNTCKRSTEEATKTTTTVAAATATATIDDQLNLKLVLIFLIVLSLELKMMDTTFAAYDLYCRISQNEDGFLHVLDGKVQVYASKTSITCNGKTALQDVLVSTVGLNENEFQRPPPDKELYRSLAFKKNVPIDRFLVAYTSCVCLDIEEMRALDRKISLSVQECFQQKCLETGGEDSATQVIVDLTTTTSTRDHRNVLLTGSRMQLLSLCLLQGATSEIPQGENISEISTATYLKTVRFTFEEEHTSHFIFSKIAPHLLEQCNSVKISTLSVQHHCLSLTITHPIKARLTLWRKDRSISQKVQFVQTATQLHGLADRAVPWQRCTGALLKDVGLAERIFWPAIDHLANAYRVPYITDVEHSNEPSSVSDVHCEQSGFPLDGQQPKERQFLSLTMEQSESLRKNFNATILEGLTCISELSSQLYGDTIHEGDDDIVADADADADTEDISCLPTSSTSQFEEEVTSSDCHLQRSTLNPETNIQSQNLLFETQDLSGEEVTPETRETYPMPREKEDDNLLGRSLFEKDRDSRRSLIIELHHKITKKSNLLNEQDGPSGALTQQVDNSAIDLQNAGKCHMTSSPNHLTSMDNSFPKGTSNSDTEPKVRNQNLMEPQSKQGPKHEGNALEKHLIGASIAKVSDPKMEEILVKWNENVRENEDSAEDQGFYEKQQFESLPIPRQSTKKPKDEATQSFTEVTMDDLKNHDGTGNTKSDHQYRSNSLFSAPGQTQHLHDVQRKTMHTIPEEEKDKTISTVKIGEGYMLQGRDERESSDGQHELLHVNKNFSQAFTVAKMKERETSRSLFDVYDDTIPEGPAGEEYIFQRKDERESSDGQHERLVNEDFSQAFTPATMKKRETSRSSFKFFDDTVPDGPVTGNSNGIQNSWIDSMSSRSTDVVDGPLKRPGSNLPVQSVILPENAAAILTSQRERNEKLRPTLQNRKEKSFQNPQLGFLSYDVLADGGTIDFLRKEDEIVDGPILTGEAFKTYQDVSICENQKASFPSNAARDEVDAGVYSPQNEANVKDPPGFGGARPKQISRNSSIRYSSTKQKITEPISTCQHNETGEFGLEPGFLERHTVRSNGAILDLHPQDGSDEPYFSARAFKDITYGDNLRLPGEGINLPCFAPSSSSQGLYAQEGFAARTSKRGDAQSLAIHQKPSLNQKESWHFPSLESPVLQRNFSGDQGLCASQQSASQSGNSIISNALFGSRGTGSAYDETDSMLNGYHHIGNVDNRLVKSPAVSDGHLSSAQDSMSSLLGSLQQIMSKTVNLIASSNAVAKQPKEAVKLSIQEEARGSREQEQAVRVEEESAQGNEETERQPIPTPVQETPRPVCSHYQRRCLVRFPCCEKFYPCHRCHNESKDCSDVPARATNATHMRCSICYHEQEIDEQSQNCSGCKSKMSDYFCATCKHFTSVEKNPFHCDKCGICRIHRDRSFHCDVCNVCLDKRLQGKHKCRPDSGHDECCICLEDAFSGCQILPCSHKVHKDCAILMIQNGVRKCPICRHPLFSQPQNSPQ